MLLYLESFGNPRKFARLARRVARAKPVLALKSGTHELRPEGRKLAHRRARRIGGRGRRALPPGRRAAPPDARGAARRRHAPLLAAAALGNNVGVVTNAGGLGILCADACESAGLELPSLSPATEARCARCSRSRRASRTPSTCSARRPDASTRRVLPVLLDDPRLDALIVLFVPPVQAGAEEVAEAILARDAGAAGQARARLGDQRRGHADVVDRERPSRRSRSRSRRPGRSATRPSAPSGCGGRSARRRSSTGIDARRGAHAAAAAQERWLTPDETRARPDRVRRPARPGARGGERGRGGCRGGGVRLPGRRQVRGRGRAQDGDRRDRARPAGRGGRSRRGRANRRAGPRPADGRGGVELLAGVVQDPVFGPLVAFGPGGVFAELIGDAAFRLAPLTDVDASELV